MRHLSKTVSCTHVDLQWNQTAVLTRLNSCLFLPTSCIKLLELALNRQSIVTNSCKQCMKSMLLHCAQTDSSSSRVLMQCLICMATSTHKASSCLNNCISSCHSSSSSSTCQSTFTSGMLQSRSCHSRSSSNCWNSSKHWLHTKQHWEDQWCSKQEGRHKGLHSTGCQILQCSISKLKVLVNSCQHSFPSSCQGRAQGRCRAAWHCPAMWLRHTMSTRLFSGRRMPLVMLMHATCRQQAWTHILVSKVRPGCLHYSMALQDANAC